MTNVLLTVPAKVESFAAMIVAQQTGEFAKENLNATFQLDPGGAASEPQELAQGTVQATMTGLNAGTMNAINAGVGLAYVGYPYKYQTGDKEGFWVNKTFVNANGTFNKSMVSTFKITLGTAGAASASAQQVQQWLEKSDVSLSQVSITNLAGPSQITALNSGAIQGAFVLSPYFEPLESNPQYVQVTGTPLATGVIEMGTGFMNQHPTVAQAILRALIRTDRTYLGPNYRSDANVMSIISTWLGVPVATINGNPAVVFSTDYDPTPLNVLVPEIQKTWLQVGGILNFPTPLKVTTVVNTSMVNAVLAKK